MEGLRLEGHEGKHTCNTTESYTDCYNECLCTHRGFAADPQQPDCLFAAYVPSDPRCDGEALCLHLTNITKPVPEAGATAGLAASSNPNDFDGERPLAHCPGMGGGGASCRCRWVCVRVLCCRGC